jgi:hypothetical protein
VLVSTSVDSSTFRLERRADGIRFTASLDGGTPATNDSDHNWDLVADPGPIAAGTVTRLDGGSFPTQGIGTIAGRAGHDIAEVDLVPQPGTRVRAVLENGYWIAAWRGGELGEHAGAEVVLRRTNGATVHVPAVQVMR